MKTILIIFTLILVTSCGKMLEPFDKIIHKKESDPRQFTKSNPIFSNHIFEFEKKFYYSKNKNIRVRNIPINFGNTNDDGNSNTIGICYSWSNGDREIIINKEWWDKNNDCNRQVLINHELGHCALGRDHKNEKLNGLKLSLMNKYHLDGDFYCENEDEYDHELFTHDHSLLEEIFN